MRRAPLQLAVADDRAGRDERGGVRPARGVRGEGVDEQARIDLALRVVGHAAALALVGRQQVERRRRPRRAVDAAASSSSP